MKLFRKKKTPESYDSTCKKPIIKACTCNSDQVAGFRDLKSGAFEEIMMIRNADDLEEFRKRFGITGDIEKVY
ncbi:MAG: aspartate dehydrogenase [Lachnospiraceae bacterium]|nr:aspartate dehydrogenase [Lachnospiraceae bacterium]